MHQTSGYLGVAGPRYTGFQEWMKSSEDYEGKGQAKVYLYLVPKPVAHEADGYKIKPFLPGV